MTATDARRAQLLATARSYDRTDPEFARRMREHAEAVEREVPRIPVIPDTARRVGFLRVVS